MRILLINPPHPAIGSRIPREHLPPLGLLALGGPLLDAGHQVRLLNADLGPMPVHQIIAEARNYQPDAVLLGHSGSTSGHPSSMRIVRAMGTALPQTWVIYGGVFPTYHWSQIMEQEPNVDFIVRGEGEETIVRLVTALEQGRTLADIRGIVFRRGLQAALRRPVRGVNDDGFALPHHESDCGRSGQNAVSAATATGGEGQDMVLQLPGLAYRREQAWSVTKPNGDSGAVVCNPPAPTIRDLDACRIGWELIDHRQYTYYGKRRAVVVQFSRGCPHRCHYCGQHEFWRTWRHRDPVKLAAELARLHREHGVELVNLADENPTASRPAWKAFLEALIAENVSLMLIGTTRAGDIVRDADILHLYKRAGVERLLLGLESTDDATLQAIHKGSTRATDREAIRLLRRHGIISMAAWVAGFVQEQDRDYWRTLRQLLAYDPDQIQALYATPHSWTPFADQELDHRVIQTDLSRWDYKHQVLASGPVPAWRVMLWVKFIEAICQLRPRSLWRTFAHRDRRFRAGMRWYSGIGRRVWPYEIWHWLFLDRRTGSGPTLREFLRGEWNHEPPADWHKSPAAGAETELPELRPQPEEKRKLEEITS